MTAQREQEVVGTATQDSIVRYAWAMKHCRGRTVLDVGCGRGAGTAILDLVSIGTVGIDKSEEAVTYAQHWQGPIFLHRSLEEYELGSNCVGTTVCLNVLQELDDPAAGLTKLLALTAPGGKVLLSVPVDGEHSVAAWDEVVRGCGKGLWTIRFYQPPGGEVDELSNCKIQYRTHSTPASSGHSIYLIGKH